MCVDSEITWLQARIGSLRRGIPKTDGILDPTKAVGVNPTLPSRQAQQVLSDSGLSPDPQSQAQITGPQ